MSDILFLVETYHMVAYRLGYSKTKCLQSLRIEVVNLVKQHYDEVQNVQGITDERYNFVKDFTATLLLKIEHLNFVIFSHKILAQNIVNPFVES